MKTMLRIGVLTLLFSTVANAATIHYYTYSGHYLEVHIAMKSAHTFEPPDILSFEVKYKPGVLPRMAGREDIELNEKDIIDVLFHGWTPERIRYTSPGTDGGAAQKNPEWSPLKKVEIRTKSRMINRLYLTFSRGYPEIMPKMNIDTDRGAFTLINPRMREVSSAEFGCKRLLRIPAVAF